MKDKSRDVLINLVNDLTPELRDKFIDLVKSLPEISTQTRFAETLTTLNREEIANITNLKEPAQKTVHWAGYFFTGRAKGEVYKDYYLQEFRQRDKNRIHHLNCWSLW